MSEITVAISQEFLEAYAKVPRRKQGKVMNMVTKFRENPRSPGLNYETLATPDPNLRSIRVDVEYRAIVLKPEQGNVYVLLWVDKHDEAYDWAFRHKVDIHPRTGSLQILSSSTEQVAAEPAPGPEEASEASTTTPDTTPQAQASPICEARERELLRLGVPEALVAEVQQLTSVTALEALAHRLPAEALEALMFLAQGEPLQEVLETYGVADSQTPVDRDDFAAALRRPDSQRRFRVVEEEHELEHMLQAPLAHWRVFLHPSQRQLVERHWNGAVRVLGGAGTGKTVVAMHRARWLARRLVDDMADDGQGKVLVTTFTRNLATDIEHQLRELCQDDELARLEVININRLVARMIARDGAPRLVYPSDKGYQQAWKRAMQLKPEDPDLPDTFFEEEFQQVILPNHLRTRQEYFRASRAGRGVALNRRQRAAIWPVFEEMRAQLSHARLRPFEDGVYEAIAMVERGELASRWSHVIVDEAQDFGAETLRLLRQLVPEGRDDLFIVGDGHQRIYGRRASLSKCGINIRGRGKKLRINYRTTEQTRRFAVALLEGQAIDDLDDGQDGQQDYRSLLQGDAPEVHHFDDFDAEMAALSERLKAHLAAHDPEAVESAGADCCVTARSQWLLDRIQGALQQHDIPTLAVSRDNPDDPEKAGVRLATLHRVKGLEFRQMHIACVNEGVIPARYTGRTEDPVEKRQREVNERALLHVAATRAIKHLSISSYGQPSPFLR
ncbi:AAA family ATPase [Halomonas almeriensis]|uniref:UvrD-helicase domain-containing protein n=1 Tax=Halomonas almeriensis TaxID=308163 RepID=UPI0025B5FAC8|nr:UvrD-helicase domain-containing protein [Halomonas almeriensis]MDN3552883.1 AAA family ATPase [Halomonas almeriensis]